MVQAMLIAMFKLCIIHNSQQFILTTIGVLIIEGNLKYRFWKNLLLK